MKTHEFHRMDTELLVERQTMRYSCRICQRTVEDGPDGITIVHKGDPTVAHRGGSLDITHEEFEQDPQDKPVWH